ncbi:hypothetical protein [Albirhodobacter sp. R86504]|jgi:hypothetical protein|uniref:hypothetical protein n=1 Tax=Albirhodobacter sp. R86504 TaxID=3093848 RepID=UPI003672C3C3
MSAHTHDFVGCICSHCARDGALIAQIIRHHDGFWEFACDAEEHDEDDFIGLCAACDGAALKAHKAGLQLKAGEWASREDISQPWEIFLLPAEGEEE